MKKSIVILVHSLAVALVFSCHSQRENNAVHSTAEEASKVKVEVYDFHATNRCVTCMAIEENTRHTLSQYFSDAMANGLVSFQVVNVDLPENAALAEQFQAYGTSLFLRINNEEQSQIVNLSEFAFMNARNGETFKTELKSRIESYL